MILTPLQKLPKNGEDWGKLIVAKGFKRLPKVQKIAQSGHTEAKLIILTHVHIFFKWAIPGLSAPSSQGFVFNIGNRIFFPISIAVGRIQTTDLLCRKRLLCQVGRYCAPPYTVPNLLYLSEHRFC